MPGNSVVRRPRYVRINTNLLTTSDAIRAFQDEGYKFIRCTSGSYDDYLKQIQSLTEYDFSQDYHVKTVFVFAAGTKLHENDLYLNNQIILQDKATALAVHLLSPPPGSVVLDMCAAPGMKTTQLAAFLRNQGKIYAVERNENRYKTLCDFVESTASKCVETIHKDALEIKRGDIDDVEYILLDPSCSGSGMELCVHNYIEEARLTKLTSLQEKFLKHAMNSFPNAKRIVYSTCSLYPEENERVVTNVVKTSRARWRVQDVKELLKGQWNNFGSGMYGSMGTRCLYAKPESDFTTGFFLAVLDREQKDNDKKQNMEKESLDVEVINKKNKKIHEVIEKCPDDVIDTQTPTLDTYNETYIKEKKKKKQDKTDINEISLEIPDNLTEDNVEIKKKKKRKKSKSVDDDLTPVDDVHNLNADDLQGAEKISLKKKKKKRTKDKEEDREIIELEISENNYLGDMSVDTTIDSKKKKKKKHCEQDTENVDVPRRKKHKEE